MKASKIISFAMILLFALLPENSIAALVIWDGNGVYEIGSGKDWFWISELRTYDDVTVTIYEGGGWVTSRCMTTANLPATMAG